jgi:hypothetical protein
LRLPEARHRTAALHSEGNRAASCLKLNYLEFELASIGDGELIAAIMP